MDYNWDDFVESEVIQAEPSVESDIIDEEIVEEEPEEKELSLKRPKYLLPSGCSKKVREKKDNAKTELELTAESTKRIIVLNLPNKTAEQEIRQFFSSCGNVLAVQNKIGASTPFLKGIALVTFSSNEEMRKAVDTLDATPFGERILKVRPHTTSIATPKKAESSTTIFVGNLDFSISKDELAAAFKHCGQILSVS